jgi:hypothetical protein
VTVVFGCRAAVAGVTYRPVIALRFVVADPRLPDGDVLTEVRGWRAAAALLMYRPVMALRLGMVPLPRFGRLRVELASPRSDVTSRHLSDRP